ncbi:hypothetical protein AZE42_13235 [Rhizopogon vesiculosus]|uniref:Uncharacterized protein n=1 Tax=Rhizopogon vesiculosus TaxID=180088 RepID=A0A1J8QUN4_9AGAM|nr:hypothetical protein AZE42_13235 [Rhizopogon vesiculosus]
MKASSKPTKQDWDPSSLLNYTAIQNPQDDFDSITCEVKSTPETASDSYDLDLTSRRYALAGVACSGILSSCCIIAGTVIIATRGGNGAIQFALYSDLQVVILGLVLNLIVTLCTESTGLVHGISLRSALASESRLRFNTNLRLLTAARGWRNPNGSLLNGVMAVLLILSYTSASFVILFTEETIVDGDQIVGTVYYGSITGLPLLLLGATLLLQAVIALSGMRASVKILTWSSSPFDVTVALVHHAQSTPVPFRCMRGVSDVDVHGGPVKPSETQHSAWHAHPSIRKVILFLWGLVVSCAGWAAVVMLIGYPMFLGVIETRTPSELWTFLPRKYSMLVSWTFWLSGDVTVQRWILSIVGVALIQGPLTLGLHCSELITNVIRDERQWRRATGSKGLRMTINPLKSFFTNPLGLVIFVAKPALHWMFGLSFDLSSSDIDDRIAPSYG